MVEVYQTRGGSDDSQQSAVKPKITPPTLRCRLIQWVFPNCIRPGGERGRRLLALSYNSSRNPEVLVAARVPR
jgi:hypothetical protein